MAINPDAAFSRADLMRRLAQVEAEVRQVQTGRRLEAATVGRGGVRVRGGSIVIQDAGGQETMRLSTDGLSMEGLLEVLGGGSIQVVEGGTIRTTGADPADPGIVELFEGRVRLSRGLPGEQNGVIQATADAGGQPRTFLDILPPRFQGAFGDVRVVVEGANVVNPQGVVFMSADAGANQVVVGNATFVVTDNQLFLVTPETTGDPANVHMTATGRIMRVTSTQRGKADIRDAQIDVGQLLSLKPRTWLDRHVTPDEPPPASPDESGRRVVQPRQQRRQVGIVAEEVHAAGMTDFVGYDAEGAPESVAYDRLSVALLAAVRHQQQQIDDLTARVEALEASY